MSSQTEPKYTESRHPGRRSTDQGTYCPKCHNMIQPGHMEDHNFHVHGIDRRKPAEETTPPPPERRKPAAKPEPKTDGDGKRRERKGSRWFDRPNQG